MAETQKANGAANSGDSQEQQFAVQRIYIKDLSLESPAAPAVFTKQWQPQLNMDLGTKTQKLDDDNHEVELSVTVTVKIGEDTAFLVEVKQAGVFTLTGFNDEQMRPMLGSYCPNLLYPYARQVVTDAVVKAGFPQLYLAPVNFDALYQQHLEEQAQAAPKEDSK
jgi:preprotein translocase subunit SecB